MSIFSYLNPKRYAAQDIAKDLIRHWEDAPSRDKRLYVLKSKDPKLEAMVIQELEKYGYHYRV